MAGSESTTRVAVAAGVAAGTGAAQLGLGYGLGVVVWPVVPGADDSVWLGSLGWATWIAASSTVFGAMIAGRLRGGRPAGGFRLALAAGAAVGALLTVVLIAVPAKAAIRPDTAAPEVVAGGYALLGVVLGLFVACWAVVSRPVTANLIATAEYLWALAAAGIVVELLAGRESATYLTSWQFAELGTQARYGTIYWPSALLTLLAALVIGVLAALPAARRGERGVGTAASGAIGPLLVAAAFLVLAPQLSGALGQLESAYLIAPYAVLAGLAGSAMTVAVTQRSAERRRARMHRASPPPATGTATVQQQDDDPAPDNNGPTAELPTVPERPAAGTRPDRPAADRTAADRPAPDRVAADRPAPDRPAPDRAAADRPAPDRAAPDRPAPDRAKPAKAERAKAEPAKAEPAKAGPARTGAGRKAAGATAAPKPKDGQDPRSTVAAPPATPTVARINPPQ
jgi:hypothetical protein